ncbi:short chain fatty acid transporter [Caldalkalibacillus thermarum TA2.A1]|uniref:Short chain fatty acid transporter n=1 Tax=Caldalkalibacillus thermarum (strain TA2.A1) TaxID=986075 RepID=F5L6P8_CALTT|nr:short chain fatty acid transporter [Caldalkalibacillus thermarum TA2.A1]QZT34593.1 TIGR00366 family protein [Caldalkalibacillus thermarum TA2.A1]
MFKRATIFFDRLMQRYLPDPFLLAVLLTFVVFLLGWGLTESTPINMLQYWGEGFWDLLAFAMQMSLVLSTC